VQNLRRGHYELITDLPAHDRVRVAFNELVLGTLTSSRTAGDTSAVPARSACTNANSRGFCLAGAGKMNT